MRLQPHRVGTSPTYHQELSTPHHSLQCPRNAKHDKSPSQGLLESILWSGIVRLNQEQAFYHGAFEIMQALLEGTMKRISVYTAHHTDFSQP